MVPGDPETTLKFQKSAPYNEASLCSFSEAPKFHHRRDSHWSLSLWLIPETTHETAFAKILNKHLLDKYIWMLLLTFWILLTSFRASLVAQMVKNGPAMQETWGQSLGREDPLERGVATHSSIPAWKIPWTEEPGGLQSMGSRRVRHNWMTKHMLNGMFQASVVFSTLFTLTGMVSSSSFYLFFQTQLRNYLLQETWVRSLDREDPPE